jgi:hypothetical protein
MYKYLVTIFIISEGRMTGIHCDTQSSCNIVYYGNFAVQYTSLDVHAYDSSYIFHETFLVHHFVKSKGFVDNGFTCVSSSSLLLKYSSLLFVLALEDGKISLFFES